VAWDISPKVGVAAQKRFYRLVRRLLDNGQARKVQMSLLETDEEEVAWTVYNAASELGSARIYKAWRLGER